MQRQVRKRLTIKMLVWRLALVGAVLLSGSAAQAGGSFTLTAVDESTGEPVPTRVVFTRADGRPQIVRRTVPSGVGFVLDGEQLVALPNGAFQFQVIRGPEYRVITGNFSIDRDASDAHSVTLPRMVDMAAEGWWSGDPAVTTPLRLLPLLMQSEDLHFAGRVGEDPQTQIRLDRPLPTAAADAPWGPIEIRQDLAADQHGLLLVGTPESFTAADSAVSSDTIRAAVRQDVNAVVVENPFAWDVPIWLASGRIKAMFLMGDWLRLDRKITAVSGSRPPSEVGFRDAHGPGRWAEHVYWQMLNSGLQIAPLGGSGSQLKNHPVGYCRTYVHAAQDNRSPDPQPIGQQAWWDAALTGQSVITNGPLLRPTLGGEYPGHVFRAYSGEALEMSVELNLSTRDPVEYLEVVHNGNVFYSARLDEFAEAGGVIPPLRIEHSGWVIVRVVTLFEDHWRAAVSAPWYIHFDDRPRISKQAVQFFRDWLSEREAMLAKLPADQRAAHAPYVIAARNFWQQQAAAANAP
ncbi:hypothetical protein UC8_17040 [Roseimaritima ulvae]|uniref:Uncharacterized protein n=2 Tax=Roseimaritima ulvae TaxID=980254 RepID=A0A5B9QRM0_9BACT|nr:hypothetical protein UC8_17040 [Roseimaritima ulvae]